MANGPTRSNPNPTEGQNAECCPSAPLVWRSTKTPPTPWALHRFAPIRTNSHQFAPIRTDSHRFQILPPASPGQNASEIRDFQDFSKQIKRIQTNSNEFKPKKLMPTSGEVFLAQGSALYDSNMKQQKFCPSRDSSLNRPKVATGTLGVCRGQLVLNLGAPGVSF